MTYINMTKPSRDVEKLLIKSRSLPDTTTN